MSLVVRKYTAQWCAPCKTLAPIVEKLAADFPDVEFKTIDIDDNPEEATAAGVTAVPTIIFEKDGAVVKTMVGLHSYGSLSLEIGKYK